MIGRARRDGGEMIGETRKGRRESIEKGSRERIEMREKKKIQKGLRRQFEEEEEHHHFPLLVHLPQGTAVLLRKHEFLNRFCSKSAGSGEVLVSSGVTW